MIKAGFLSSACSKRLQKLTEGILQEKARGRPCGG